MYVALRYTDTSVCGLKVLVHYMYRFVDADPSQKDDRADLEWAEVHNLLADVC